jgi:hypothetical protein
MLLGNKLPHESSISWNIKGENMNKTCLNCKCWDEEWTKNYYEFGNKGFGKCDSKYFYLGYCREPYEREITTSHVVVEDDEGWGFMTGKDFGCIHFEEK